MLKPFNISTTTTNNYIYVHINVYIKPGIQMKTKNVTLKVDSKLYDKYRTFCKKKGLIASRQFEICMEKQMDED